MDQVARVPAVFHCDETDRFGINRGESHGNCFNVLDLSLRGVFACSLGLVPIIVGILL